MSAINCIECCGDYWVKVTGHDWIICGECDTVYGITPPPIIPPPPPPLPNPRTGTNADPN